MANDNINGNRIVPGGELELNEQSQLNSVGGGSSEQTAAQGIVKYQGDFPNVDMYFLNSTLVKYLEHIMLPRSGAIEEQMDLLEDDIQLKDIVSSAGLELIQLRNFHYEPVRYPTHMSPIKVLHAKLELSSHVTIAGLKTSLVKTFDNETANYYLSEFEDLLGIKHDNTRLINISNPAIHTYFPIVSSLMKLAGDYQVAGLETVGNYYLLLMALSPEDRPKLGLFFKEAHEQKYKPFEITAGNRYITESEIERIVKEPTIIGIHDLIIIGKKYNIKGLKQYIDRLAGF